MRKMPWLHKMAEVTFPGLACSYSKLNSLCLPRKLNKDKLGLLLGPRMPCSCFPAVFGRDLGFRG